MHVHVGWLRSAHPPGATVRGADSCGSATQDNTEAEVEAYLRRKYEGRIANAVVVDKEDLDLKNHLTGLKRPYLKVRARAGPLALPTPARTRAALPQCGLG